MKTQRIRKTIEINAPKENVWEVLLNDKFNRVWYAEFGEGVYAETDWKIGSKALFVDNTKSGLIGTIISNKQFELLSVEYAGIVSDGIEDYDSNIANGVKSGRETYRLVERDAKTYLSIECDMAEDLFEHMSSAWDKALQKLKKLSESQPELQS